MRFGHVPPQLATQPFTRQQAYAAGLTDRQLESDQWRQVFRTVWVHVDAPDTRAVRLTAAKLMIPEAGVLCGLTASWVLGVDVRRLDDLDVHVGFPKGKRIRKRPGLEVCQETLADEDITIVDGVSVTTPLRTTFDCLRWLWHPEGIVVADALTHAELVDTDELKQYFSSKKRLRNLRIGERLLEFVEPKAESPMETRLRLVLLDGGLPRAAPQWNVLTDSGAFVGRLDLAYPEHRVAVEYDGAFHWEQRREDDRRRAALRALGWEIYVYSSDDVFKHPQSIVAEVRRALRSRAA
jgi:very-short-patch-repair endonuclease